MRNSVGRAVSVSPLMQLLNTTINTKKDPRNRMLVMVRLMGTIWDVRLVVNTNESVQGLIKAALMALFHEGRLSGNLEMEAYELLPSLFSLQGLNMDERLSDLGSRSFCLRRKF